MATVGKLNRKQKFEEFVKKVQQKAPKRKPVRTKKKSLTGTLFAKRNTRLAIREAALRGVCIVILYEKVTDHTINKYYVFPLSYRFRKLKQGRRKVLFALDVRENKQIKMFCLKNIYKVAITDRKVKSRFPIEII